MAQTNLNNTDPSNGNTSAPITYTKFQRQQTEYQVFPEEFFSGSDVTVYFGDLYVDTITGLEFTLQEQLRPIFGYADYTYSDISRGQRLVQGTFRIAFKESGYLFTILEHIAQLGDKAKPALAYLETANDVPDWHASARQTIEDLLDYYYNPSGDTYTENDVMENTLYDWPDMQINSKDTDSGMQTSQAKEAGLKGAVSHLQSALIAHGYTFPSADTTGFAGLKARFKDGDMWPTKEQMDATYAQYGQQTTKWNIHGVEHTTRFYGTNHPSYAVNWYSDGRDPVTPLKAGQDAPIDVEKRLEARLQQYDFLKDQEAMDFNGTWGKYTDLVRHAVALFQHFAARAPDALTWTEPVEAEWVESQFGGKVGWGGWVDQGTANLLAKGLSTPTGEYDVATRQCVYKFQKDNGLVPTGICDSATRDKMSLKFNSKMVKTTEKTASGTTRSGLESNTSRNLESRLATYEAEIWGRDLSGDNNHNRRTFFYDGGFTSTGTEPYLPKMKKTGFDMFITYGPIGVWALQNAGPNKPNGSLDDRQPGSTHAPFPNSVHAIRAVQLASIGQVINADGTPIEEIYAFMAKDLD